MTLRPACCRTLLVLLACSLLIDSLHAGRLHGVAKPGSCFLCEDAPACVAECKKDLSLHWKASCAELKKNEKDAKEKERVLIEETLQLCEHGVREQDMSAACTEKCKKQEPKEEA
mmetsp:Transcript_5529/g.8850  ORF Transcript_5529/g.8850 Transcript_5529/m.8850 type:complete len:115 (+) Transcript_5529:29-373(+)